jgi:hypothetical protein
MEAFILEGSGVPITTCPKDGWAIKSFDHDARREETNKELGAMIGTND